jgi:hypothetical protein
MSYQQREPQPLLFSHRAEIPAKNCPLAQNPTNLDALEKTMLQYILDKYAENGEDILTDKQKRLLPHYIEAYNLNQKFLDPNGEFHIIHRLVHEAGSYVRNQNTLISKSKHKAGCF